MKPAYLVDTLRTPIGSLGGSLASVRADDLAAHVLRELVARNSGLDPHGIEDVILGCANQAGEDNRNVARMALLLAGLPQSVAGQTVNRLCASGLSAAMDAARSIMCGDSDLLIAGGVEQMTRAPWVLSKSETAFGRQQELYDSSFGWRFINPKMHERFGTDAMGATAEHLAEQFNISREDQDAFALQSQQKASLAQASGRLAREITGVLIPQKKGEPRYFEADEFIKPQTHKDALSKLKPVFKKNGTVTAGNSSGLNDGAAALLLASEAGIKTHQLKPLARIVASGVCGVEPRIMGIGPVEASYKALKRAGLTIHDMDLIELNEAFAAQSLACLRSWKLEDNDPRVNVNGGAIALGHPLGMSGARILGSAALELQYRNLQYALVTMCIGVGQGFAVIIERAS